MFERFSILAGGVLVLGTVNAAASELPRYQVSGLPITQDQLAVLEPPNAEQDLSPLSMTVAGMPASPHQIAVLAPRTKRFELPIARKSASEPQARFTPIATTETPR